MTRDHFVYRIFNAAGRCLYVGCTKYPESRWRQHALERPMMVKHATRKLMSGPYERAVALKIERSEQERLQPLFDPWSGSGRHPSRFGPWAQLRIIRERTGWSSAELSRTSGVSAPYLSQLENGDRWPNATVTKKLAVALKVPVSVLERPVEQKGVA